MTRRSDDDAGVRELRQCQAMFETYAQQNILHTHRDSHFIRLGITVRRHIFCMSITIDIGHDVPGLWTAHGLRS
jgi:hypothetical protein